MTRFQVDSEAVAATTSAAQAAMGRIQSEVGMLHRLLTELQSSWSGPAAAAFQAAVGDWRATQLRVEESIAGLNLALAQAGQAYAQAEQQNLSMFAR